MSLLLFILFSFVELYFNVVKSYSFWSLHRQFLLLLLLLLGYKELIKILQTEPPSERILQYQILLAYNDVRTTLSGHWNDVVTKIVLTSCHKNSLENFKWNRACFLAVRTLKHHFDFTDVRRQKFLQFVGDGWSIGMWKLVGMTFHIIDGVFVSIDQDKRMFTKLNASSNKQILSKEK